MFVLSVTILDACATSWSASLRLGVSVVASCAAALVFLWQYDILGSLLVIGTASALVGSLLVAADNSLKLGGALWLVFAPRSLALALL